jgi:hypothetical protein
MPAPDENLPTDLDSLFGMSAKRLSALFKEWDAAIGKGPDAEQTKAAIVDELTRYYPEEAGLSRIATLLDIEVRAVAGYRAMARGEDGFG